MKWKRSEYKVAAVNGGAPIRKGWVEPSGVFAIESGTWKITHLPTGQAGLQRDYRSTSYGPLWVEWTFRMSKELVARLLALPFDWSKLTEKDALEARVNDVPLGTAVRKINEKLIAETYD